MESKDTSPTPAPAKVVHLKPIEATPESFQEFGQIIEASPDGEEFGPHDALLDLSRGTPRFYIMHLEGRSLKFSTITHHADVTQCLGSIGGHVWYLGVAKPSIVDASEATNSGEVVKSKHGHFYTPPSIDNVRAFRISGPKFVKLNVGTWHAGPLFTEKAIDFYNLELSNTNMNHATVSEAALFGIPPHEFDYISRFTGATLSTGLPGTRFLDVDILNSMRSRVLNFTFVIWVPRHPREQGFEWTHTDLRRVVGGPFGILGYPELTRLVVKLEEDHFRHANDEGWNNRDPKDTISSACFDVSSF